jgi:acetyl-CoA carboxylase biotin carboxylase subunit
MLSKLVAWAPTRDQAIARLLRALDEYTVHGITTNLAYLAAVLRHPAFRAGEYDTTFCARHAAALLRPPDPALEEVGLIAAALSAYKRDEEEAEAFAARAGATAAGGSPWLRQGRARALRGVVR